MNQNLSMNRRSLLHAGLGFAAVIAVPNLSGCVATGSARKGFFAARELPIGLQLYTLGDAIVKEDLDGTLQRVAAIGYRTIELPGVKSGETSRIRAAADKAGLAITAVHVGSGPASAEGPLTVQADLAQLAGQLQVLGCRDVVVPFPLLPSVTPAAGEDMLTALRRAFRSGIDHWKRTAALLNERGEALRREGLSLSYHNHDLEFITVSGTRGWDILVADTDPKLVFFEIDIGWVVAGGLDPVAFVEGLAGRVRQLHVKDLNAPSEPKEALKMDSTEVGSGVVDWKKVLGAAYRAGARQFYVEQEPPFKIDRFEAVSKSYAYLNNL
jgi:sugar phosphate isomerase/epimerase